MGEITEALRQLKQERQREASSAAGSSPAEHGRRRRGSAPASAPRGLESRDPDRKPRGLRASARAGEGVEGFEIGWLHRFACLVLRRRVLVMGVFVVTLGCVTAATLLMMPIYESTAVLLVKLRPEYSGAPEAGSLPKVPIRQIINTEIEILGTHEVIEGVVTSLGTDVLYPDLVGSHESGVSFDVPWARPSDAKPVHSSSVALATARFADDLRIEAVSDAQVIRVSFEHLDPELAAKAVNLLVEHYKERHLFAFAEVRATAFLEEKVRAYRKELDEKDDRIRAFLERNGGFAIADLGDLVGRQRRELTSELNSVRSEIAASRRELAHLTKQRSSMSKYEAVDLQADLDKRILAAKAQLSGLEARESTVKGQMVRYDQELADIPALRKEYQNLARERDSTERLYNTYSSQLEEALVSEEMDRQKIANVTVLQAGPVPASPIRPRKLLNVSVGTAVAGMLAVLAALLMEASQPTPTGQLSLDSPGTHRVRLDADSA